MERLKEAFVIIIKCWIYDDEVVPFELENKTAERLTLRQMDNFWLLVRCPIVREEDKWAGWEKDAIEWELRRERNFIYITFKDRDIGMLDANDEGPSEPRK
ncbi:hypothetical protein GPALN_005374 [Globodera pallida]|nr:hypothetical protein GPALN_005374 [Globodera pallida]